MPSHRMNVPRISPPSADVFEREYVRKSQPVILDGVMSDWPATRKWSFAYMRERWGALEVPVIKLQDRTTGRDPSIGLLYESATLRQAVDLLSDDNDPGYYMVASIEGPLRPIFDDVEIPRYCAGKPRLRSRLWMSAGNTVSPLHRDFPENIYAQILGHKRFILFPPGNKRMMYPHSLRSKLPQFCAVDPEKPDYVRYPRFRNARSTVVDLGPGDMLYLPGRWWHQVRSLTPSLSINWWWATGIVRLLTNAADLYKRVRNVRL